MVYYFFIKAGPTTNMPNIQYKIFSVWKAGINKSTRGELGCGKLENKNLKSKIHPRTVLKVYHLTLTLLSTLPSKIDGIIRQRHSGPWCSRSICSLLVESLDCDFSDVLKTKHIHALKKQMKITRVRIKSI